MTRLQETEKDFSTWVIDYAHLRGWRIAHFRPARTLSGDWVTPVQADGPGFPDFVLVREARVVFAEIKSDKGKTSVEQEAWRNALTPAVVEGNIEYYLWRPGYRENIERILI